MTVFIHAGRSKTGTSYLQTIMANNGDALLEKGLVYPALGSAVELAQAGLPTAGNAVYLALLLANPSNLPKNIKEDKIVHDLQKACNKNSKKNIILSSELFEMLNADGIKKLSNIFSSIGRDVHFIHYIRSPVSALESIYAQSVKRHGGTQGLDKYVFSLKLWTIKYYQYFDWLSESKIPFTIRKYEKSAFVNGRIELDFFAAMGADFSQADLIYPEKNINPTPSRFGLNVLRECNLLGDGLAYYDRNTAAAIKVDKVLGLSAGVFEPHHKKYISEHTKKNMQILYDKYSVEPFLDDIQSTLEVPTVDYNTYRFLFLRALSEIYGKV